MHRWLWLWSSFSSWVSAWRRQALGGALFSLQRMSLPRLLPALALVPKRHPALPEIRSQRLRETAPGKA
jgi:hypothetical protein